MLFHKKFRSPSIDVSRMFFFGGEIYKFSPVEGELMIERSEANTRKRLGWVRIA